MRWAALTAATLGLLAFSAGSAPAQDAVSLAPTGAQFPERAYRINVPDRRDLGPEDIQVTENGERVNDLSFTLAGGQRSGELGLVLVIDASASMRGRAILSAVEAAREFAAQRRGAQQLGVIVFNKTARVLLAPTDDQRAINGVLSRPPQLAPQTHVVDAVSSALDLLARSKITSGSVVVLSDGADTGSRLAANAVGARARKANIPIYSVGLRSGAFNPSGLRGLATASGGRYIPVASVFDLRRIFRGLGTELASGSLIRYRSIAEPGSDVTVAARIGRDDTVATSSYRVPGGATFVQVERSLWTSGLGIALTGLACALLLAFALGTLLLRRRRPPSLRDRVGGFVSNPEDVSPIRDVVLTGGGSRGADRSLDRFAWWIDLKQDMEIARIEADPLRVAMITMLTTLVVMFLLVKLSGLPPVGAFALAIPWGVRTWVRVNLARQRARFIDQLPDVLQSAASAIRAGHGLVAALSMVAEEAPEPSRTEFLRVVADESVGVPLEEALRGVQRRMGSREVLQIALVAQIQREAGGNMAEVLDRITESLRQSGELRRMVKALTAQGRLSRWVVTALPLMLLLVISVLSPDYVKPLYTETLGLVMLVSAGFMMFMGSFAIGKIVDFEI